MNYGPYMMYITFHILQECKLRPSPDVCNLWCVSGQAGVQAGRSGSPRASWGQPESQKA